MLKVFVGPDTAKARHALALAIEEFRKNNPNGLVSRFDGDHADPSEVSEALFAQSMFGDAACVVFDNLSEKAESCGLLVDILPDAAKSTNTVIVLEVNPKKEIRDLLKTHSKEIKEFLQKAAASDTAIFVLGDALGAKDKRTLWSTLVRLTREGYAPEELHGTLFWAAKSLFLAKTLTPGEAEAAGVKGYTYTKFSGYSQKWTEKELRDVLDQLKEVIHERGEQRGADLGILLEEFVLGL